MQTAVQLHREKETDNKTGIEEPELGGSSRINIMKLHIILLQQDKSTINSFANVKYLSPQESDSPCDIHAIAL